jgi:hypothetical protein
MCGANVKKYLAKRKKNLATSKKYLAIKGTWQSKNCNKKKVLFFKEIIKTLPKRGFEVGTLHCAYIRRQFHEGS